MTMTAAEARRFLAEEVRVTANIRSPLVIEAIATTARERFLPPGPWLIRGVYDTGGARHTDDADRGTSTMTWSSQSTRRATCITASRA
jgi:hypothetical protein